MKTVFYIIFFVLACSSCHQTVLRINKVPANTPVGALIYVTGNFNHWDPGDARYQMQQLRDSSYVIKLPQTIGRVEYKFTRGNWSTVEMNRCGNELENHYLSGNRSDTVSHIIECWSDLEAINCDSITLVVENIPKNTPINDTIKIAGSFNAWNPGSKPEFVVKKDSVSQKYIVTIPRISWKGNESNILTYKFVRKDITVSEADKFGRELEPRILNFEKGDSVKVSIENWSDLADPQLNTVTIVLPSVPANTPDGQPIYLTGNFNNWNPSDSHYTFSKNKKNQYQISIPRQKYGLSFKITRGSWSTEFCDACGRKLENQDYNYDEIDTVYVNVEGWLDLKNEMNSDLVLIVNQVPSNTLPSDVLFLDGYEYFSGIKPKGFPFKRNENGTYELKAKQYRLNGNYVITRGSHSTQEVTKSGQFIVPHSFTNICSDTLFLAVERWNDEVNSTDKLVTLNIVKIPKKTAEKKPIFITGQFNGWNPSDELFVLERNSAGVYSIKLPLRYLKGGFKFTQGSWGRVEGDKSGKYLENRTYTGDSDKLDLTIESWEGTDLFP